MKPVLAVPALAMILAGCASGPPSPARVDTRNDRCSWCRMAVSDLRYAAQIVAPGEEPRFFDDPGCLRDYLAGGAEIPRHATAYVADHRTKDWVAAAKATFGRVAPSGTPMSSGIAAWADDASRAADADAAATTPLSVAEIFGRSGPPGSGS